jgi:hypothetical protein
MDTELSDAAKAARREMREVYERAYTTFLDKLEIVPTPKHFPLPYGTPQGVMVSINGHADGQWLEAKSSTPTPVATSHQASQPAISPILSDSLRPFWTAKT